MSTIEEKSRSLTLLNLLVFAALLALFLSLSIHQIVNFDIWWHLKTGQYILQNLAVPGSDIYTFTYSGSRWIDHQWLFQVAIHPIYSFMGPDGLIIFQALILGAAFIFIVRAVPGGPPLAVSGIIVMCAIFVCEERFIVRPEIITLLFTAVYIFILKRKSAGLIPFIPLLQIIWVNIHGGFIIGLAILYLYLIGEIIQGLLSRERGTGDRRALKTLASVAVISTAVCLLNPYGIKGAVFPFTALSNMGGRESLYSMSIGELLPPLSWGPMHGKQLLSGAASSIKQLLSANVTHSVFFFRILIFLSALSIVLNLRKLRISSLLVYAAFLYLALSARRNMALFSLAAIPLSVENFAPLWGRLGGKRKTKMAAAAIAAAIVLLTVSRQLPSIISGRYYMKDNITKRFGLGFSPMMYPREAAAFLKNAPPAGRIFNDLASGGLLIWELSPGGKVFVDGRLEVIPVDFYRGYLETISSPEKYFDEVAERYDIQMVILNHRAVGRRLLDFLHRSPLWQPVHFDEIGVVFCRNSAENATFISEHLIDFATTAGDEAIQGEFPYGHFYRGSFFMTIGLHDKAFEEYRKGLRLFPSYAPGYNAMGRIHEERGEIDIARALYRKALEIDPVLFDAHLNLGNLELQNGSIEEALAQYKKALAIKPSSLDATVNLGTALYKTDNVAGAIEQYRKALAIDPASGAAIRNLRIVMDNQYN
ncbi:MAG: tetratricopeptide repeat protein [Candidatus Tritonobacter lacicola]|nr:tetratricopeptide repeat protein [Candidatus Tritonobacter lacicola]